MQRPPTEPDRIPPSPSPPTNKRKEPKSKDPRNRNEYIGGYPNSAPLTPAAVGRLSNLRLLVLLPDDLCHNSTLHNFKIDINKLSTSHFLVNTLKELARDAKFQSEGDWLNKVLPGSKFELDWDLLLSNFKMIHPLFSLSNNCDCLISVTAILARMLTSPHLCPPLNCFSEKFDYRAVSTLPPMRSGCLQYGSMSHFHVISRDVNHRRQHTEVISGNFDMIVVGSCHLFESDRNTPDFSSSTHEVIQFLSDLSLSRTMIFPPLSVLEYVTHSGTNPSSPDTAFPHLPLAVRSRPAQTWEAVTHSLFESGPFSGDSLLTQYVAKSTQGSSSRSVMIFGRFGVSAPQFFFRQPLNRISLESSQHDRATARYPPTASYRFERCNLPLHRFTYRVFTGLSLSSHTQTRELDHICSRDTGAQSEWLSRCHHMHCVRTESTVTSPVTLQYASYSIPGDYYFDRPADKPAGSAVLADCIRHVYDQLGSTMVGIPFRFDLVYRSTDRTHHPTVDDLQAPCNLVELAVFPCCETFLLDSTRAEQQIIQLARYLFSYFVHHIGVGNGYPS